jgi:hypothetical protein
MGSQQQISTNTVTTKDPHSPSSTAVKEFSLVVILLFHETVVAHTKHILIASFSPSPIHTPSHQQNTSSSLESQLGFYITSTFLQLLVVDVIFMSLLIHTKTTPATQTFHSHMMTPLEKAIRHSLGPGISPPMKLKCILFNKKYFNTYMSEQMIIFLICTSVN